MKKANSRALERIILSLSLKDNLLPIPCQSEQAEIMVKSYPCKRIPENLEECSARFVCDNSLQHTENKRVTLNVGGVRRACKFLHTDQKGIEREDRALIVRQSLATQALIVSYAQS